MTKAEPLKTYFLNQIWKDNQILAAVLGICSALGITNSVSISVTMGIAVTFVTASSSLMVSLIRKFIPDSVRMIAQLAIISMFVIIVDQLLQAYAFDLWKKLSVFVGLIITNCLVMGRAEAMARNVSPLPALMDGLGAGLGYSFVIIIVGAVREVFGFGTFWGIQVIPDSAYAVGFSSGYQNFNLMVLPPAAFFIIGGLIFIFNRVNNRSGQ
ncbi:NADH:ubiquinone reductase (Na(+)-transporting) subunit D [Chlamydiia bacterium]|jgi:Na+-transporting NADH:ubiquinone oxidoreductase subunit D|nr:NADH:ubiquinone reductase (Na(+)-transporting) subunit D [Chlamydiia bacterium]